MTTFLKKKITTKIRGTKWADVIKVSPYHLSMKQYGVSHLLVLFQSHARLCSIRSFNEDQLVSLDVLQDALQTNTQKLFT